MRVILREPVLDNYLNNPKGKVGRFLRRKGNIVMRAAKRQVGVRTGALRSSIHMRHFREARGQFIMIGSEMDYALMHHEGTKPHLITASRGQKMRFVSRGQAMYTHVVRHPGTKANKYLSDNLRLIKK